MQKILTSIIGTAVGTAISGSVIGSSIIITQNRKEAHKNIHTLDETYNFCRIVIEYIESAGIGYRQSEKGVVEVDTSKEWYRKQIMHQEKWLALPFYKQLKHPPFPILIGDSNVKTVTKTPSWF